MDQARHKTKSQTQIVHPVQRARAPTGREPVGAKPMDAGTASKSIPLSVINFVNENKIDPEVCSADQAPRRARSMRARGSEISTA